MIAIDRMIAIEEIKQLKARYFRTIDTKHWPGLEAVFAPDARFDISQDVPDCVIIGAANIARMVAQSLSDVLSVHHGHCPEIEVTSETTATGTWAMEDVLRWPEGSESPVKSLHGYGHYIESYRRVDGRWLIQSLRLTRLRVNVEPRHPR